MASRISFFTGWEKLPITQQSSERSMPVSGATVSTVTAAPKAMATVTAGKMIAREVCGVTVSVAAAPTRQDVLHLL
jgi:hypothetical protein